MSEEKLPKTYKFKLEADDFKQLLFASDDKFWELKEKMLHEGKIGVNGVSRETLDDSSMPDFLFEEKKCTILSETEITGDIKIDKIQKIDCNSLLCRSSKFRRIHISESILKDSIELDGGNFVFDNCMIEVIRIYKKSILGNFAITGGSTIRAFNIFNDSQLGDFEITDSSLDNFFLSKCCTVGEIEISNSKILFCWLRKTSKLKNFKMVRNSILNLVKIENESTIKDFLINNSNILDFYMTNSSMDNLNILNNSTAGNFSIEKSIGKNFSVHDSNMKHFNIITCQNDNFSIYNSTTGSFNITTSKTGKLSIHGSTTGNFELFNSSTEYFAISNSKTGNLNISNDSNIGDLITINSKLGEIFCQNLCNSIYISASEITLIRLDKCTIPVLKVAISCKIEAYVTGGQINQVDFSKTTFNKDTIFSFYSTKIYELLLDQFAMLGNLFFRRLSKLEEPYTLENNLALLKETSYEIKDISLDEKQYSERISRLTKQIEKYQRHIDVIRNRICMPTIRISQSSLGKTEFTDCQLADFNFEFNNSKIIDCFISGGSVPEDNFTIIDPISKKAVHGIKEHEQKASFYNQLKKIFEAQGDVYNATIFQAKWAECQRGYLMLLRKNESLYITGNYFQKVKKRVELFFDNISQDRFSLWLNKISNKHGESWLRALGCLTISSIIFYLMYLLSLGRCFNGNMFDSSLIGYFFEFLNPLHKTNFIPDNMNVNTWTYVVDFFGKVVITFLIYKFLSAFRKHGKK